VETAIVRSLARDPAERYASGAEFAAALAGRQTPSPTKEETKEPVAKKGCAAVLFLAAGLAAMAAHIFR
jgi:hypothetical protein